MNFIKVLDGIQKITRDRYADKQIGAAEIRLTMERINNLKKLSKIVFENRSRRATIRRRVARARDFFNGSRRTLELAREILQIGSDTHNFKF